MTAPAPAAFACRRTLRTSSLRLSVDGIGGIPLPVSGKRTAALVAAGRPAPFGLGERTLVDPSVRNVTEIDAARVAIGEVRWDIALRPTLESMRVELGLPRGTLTARLHKLLVYGPGGFFLPHRDTERDDAMIGTLVVVLPCPHRGGALTVEHAGTTRRFTSADMPPDELLLIAFYGDCLHEVRRVTEGHRIVLSHELHFEPETRAGRTMARRSANDTVPDEPDRPARAGAGAPVAAKATSREDALLDRVLPRFFERDGPGGEPPPHRLVYLLDHQYSRGSLDWGRLKGGDGDWARRLRRAAARLDLRPWLALVTIREVWSTAGSGWNDRRHRRGQDVYRDDDWAEDDGTENDDGTVRTDDGQVLELVELVDDERVLEHLRDARGRRRDWPAIGFDEGELVHVGTMPAPDEMEHEGWMGNYGDTLERRYHRAAVVLWPAHEHWRNLLDAGPRTLLAELLGEHEGAPAEALVAFATLGDDWPPRYRSRDAEALGEALELATRWNDAKATLRLLGGFDLAALTGSHLTALVRLGALHDESFACRLVDLWFDPALDSLSDRRSPVYHQADSRGALAWLPALPALCTEAATAGAQATWRPALARLTGRLLRATLAENASGRRAARPSERRAASAPATVRWTALLDAVAALDDRGTTDAVAAALLGDVREARPEVGHALVDHLAAHDGAPLGEARTRELRRHVRKIVQAALKETGREADDWSLPAPPGCDCTHCRALKKFAKSGRERTLEVRAAQEQRQHVEQRVRVAELPLDLRTDQRGRPYTLVLSKRATLFADARREANVLRRMSERLDELDRG